MTTRQVSESRLASLGSRAISAAYVDLESRFREVTLRARDRFDDRDWTGMAADARERLRLYGEVARSTAEQVAQLMGDRLMDKSVWAAMKAAYSGFAMDRQDFELAETFFNSITRRTFATVGVDPKIEFVDTDFSTPPTEGLHPPYRVYEGGGSTRYLVDAALKDAGFGGVGDVSAVAQQIEQRISPDIVDRLELATSVFYRGKGAYVVGRVVAGPVSTPIAIALENRDDGVVIDAVLLTEDEVSVLFSFAHSYFHVASERPYDLVRFVNELVPRKRYSELYISLGHTRHGKTELFRELRRHIESSDDLFVEPPGKKGLVMSVFTLPGFEIVLKVIKDKFPPQKSMTPGQVMAKYRLVFHHDRAGRLVDSQSFEHLQFNADRFDSELLEELLTECSRTVRKEGEMIEVDLAYAQRRVSPLDVYVREAELVDARSAVIDFGNAIRDLAVTGIFPGDLLIKNFGVTRNDRVVFYDYDELTEIGNCNFRNMPIATSVEDEMAATPWFPLGPDDVFPSEFVSFLGLTAELRKAFTDQHSDLFEAAWWIKAQETIASGEVVSIYPYPDETRLQAG
ncbi:MAG: bifunctional isocitrate dehydrogenase kinase/phosphatase [Actinomycetota bacterium]|nr:bifunctional isocitrate dehydrogenase kinase/phosphatase [Actinomycetota bacterium]